MRSVPNRSTIADVAHVLDHLERSPIVPLVMYTAVSITVYVLMGPPILVLVIPFAIAYLIWFIWFRNRPVPVSTAFLRLYITMYVIQIAHLLEEWNTGFYEAFPALWGSLWFGDPGRYEPWNQIVFINGNLLMDAFWEIAILLFARRGAWANYTLWLFLSGMVVNAVGHPFYTLYLAATPTQQEYLSATYGLSSTWYFPGLFTSFLHIGIVVAMIIQLRRDYSGDSRPRTPLDASLVGSLPRLTPDTVPAGSPRAGAE
jgi:hypothetical protein